MKEMKVDPPICIGCGKPISPQRIAWDLFRVGINVHQVCLDIWTKIDHALRRKTR